MRSAILAGFLILILPLAAHAANQQANVTGTNSSNMSASPGSIPQDTTGGPERETTSGSSDQVSPTNGGGSGNSGGSGGSDPDSRGGTEQGNNSGAGSDPSSGSNGGGSSKKQDVFGGTGRDNFGSGSSGRNRAWYLCNQTGEAVVHVAYRYQNQGEWFSSGWRRIDRGKCITALKHATFSRVHYFAAGKTKAYSGTKAFCVRMSKHGEKARTNCPNGFKKLPFREVKLNKGETRTDIR